MVIGKGGETIRSLEADYEVQIDIEEDGTIRIYGTNGELAEAARDAIDAMTQRRSRWATPTPARSSKLADFGAFVQLRKGVDGLLHVSRILPKGQRLALGRAGARPRRPGARRRSSRSTATAAASA